MAFSSKLTPPDWFRAGLTEYLPLKIKANQKIDEAANEQDFDNKVHLVFSFLILILTQN